MAKIIKEGSFFRAVADGYKSQLVTSASQAGRNILRKFGKKAYEVAYYEYTGQ